MRTLPIAVLMLCAAVPARAGVYPISDPQTLSRAYGGNPEMVVATLRFESLPLAPDVPDRLFALRSLPLEPDVKMDELAPRSLYLRQIAYFERLGESRPLAPVEAVGLSACYLRLAPPRGLKTDDGKDADVKEYRKKARRVLQEADRGHFLVQAALAAYYQHEGNYDWAISHQKAALEAWPRVWTYWTGEQLAFYRDCELYNLKVLEFRQARPDESPTAAVSLDPLFPFVPPSTKAKKKGRDLDLGLPTKPQEANRNALRFVNDKGNYVAGDLADDEAVKIPQRAGSFVLQLNLWQPRDRRLCWMLAELLNANGHVEPAAKLMASMVESEKLEWPELREHQRILDRAAPTMKLLREKAAARIGLSAGLSMLLPVGDVGAPLGDATSCALIAHVAIVGGPMVDDPKWAAQPPKQPTPADPPSPPAPLNVQHVVVSFVFGVLVASLLGMQWQALLKRRRPTPEPIPPPAEPVAAGGPEPRE